MLTIGVMGYTTSSHNKYFYITLMSLYTIIIKVAELSMHFSLYSITIGCRTDLAAWEVCWALLWWDSIVILSECIPSPPMLCLYSVPAPVILSWLGGHAPSCRGRHRGVSAAREYTWPGVNVHTWGSGGHVLGQMAGRELPSSSSSSSFTTTDTGQLTITALSAIWTHCIFSTLDLNSTLWLQLYILYFPEVQTRSIL